MKTADRLAKITEDIQTICGVLSALNMRTKHNADHIRALEASAWADDVGATDAVGPTVPSQATERAMLRRVIAEFDRSCGYGMLRPPRDLAGELSYYIGHIRRYLDRTEPKGEDDATS